MQKKKKNPPHIWGGHFLFNVVHSCFNFKHFTVHSQTILGREGSHYSTHRTKWAGGDPLNQHKLIDWLLAVYVRYTVNITDVSVNTPV